MTLGRQLGIRDPQQRSERRRTEHQSIYAAIAAGDAGGARDLMRKHIMESRDRLLNGGP
jgi:DNA-binding GntR family transcriptional regulator